MSAPIRITKDLPGIGGTLRTLPADFAVTEIPAYEPGGSGEHVYLTLRRQGWTTRDVQSKLASMFGLKAHNVGTAGLKDKDAVATQMFSLHLHAVEPGEVARKVAEETPFEVLNADRHLNKLRTGHLRGNRFRIVVRDIDLAAAERIPPVAETIRQHGLPNYYGPQRMGLGGHNGDNGREIILGTRKARPWERKLFLSAFQSELFNEWLARRITDGFFETLVEGDVACRLDSGGQFVVEDLKVDLPRLADGEIACTGPMFGYRMRRAAARAGEIEDEILAGSGVTLEDLQKARLEGTRRQARLTVDDLAWEMLEEGAAAFTFTLPRGSYATVLLDEFMKNSPR